MSIYQGWQGDKPLFKVNLTDKWISRCQEMPESGMGYQKVNCKVLKGEGNSILVPAIVLNCSILESVESIPVQDILDIFLA